MRQDCRKREGETESEVPEAICQAEARTTVEANPPQQENETCGSDEDIMILPDDDASAA